VARKVGDVGLYASLEDGIPVCWVVVRLQDGRLGEARNDSS